MSRDSAKKADLTIKPKVVVARKETSKKIHEATGDDIADRANRASKKTPPKDAGKAARKKN